MSNMSLLIQFESGPKKNTGFVLTKPETTIIGLLSQELVLEEKSIVLQRKLNNNKRFDEMQ